MTMKRFVGFVMKYEIGDRVIGQSKFYHIVGTVSQIDGETHLIRYYVGNKGRKLVDGYWFKEKELRKRI
jgi:hypothetical protein